MGLLEKIFPKQPKAAQSAAGYFKTFTAYSPIFNSVGGSLYEMELVRSAIHAHATHSAKLKPIVTGVANPKLKNMLAFKPNGYTDTYKFLYRLRTILEIENTAFIVPLYFGKADDTVIGFYALCPSRCEVLEYNGTEYLRYTFSNGQKAAIEFDRCGIMTRHQYRDEFFGESNDALRSTAELITATNTGIREGIRNGATVRFIGKLGNTYKPTDLEEQRKNFRQANLQADNNGGIVLVDNRYTDLKQINSTPYMIDATQMQTIQDNVFTYYGINKRIIQNDFNEEMWNAYYEGAIEPFALQLGLVLTGMVFTPREIAAGNEITFSSNRLQYASNTTKLNVVTQMFDRGMMTFNEGLEIFNMPPVEDGDKRYIRKEYAEVSRLGEDDKIESEPIEEGENE